MSKTTLIIIGIVLVLMGIGALIPSIGLATEPVWHAVAKILIGIVAVGIGMADKKAVV